MYADNDERAIFFAKGVVETVKIDWVPDIIHVHGWMAHVTNIQHYYKTKRCFHTKIVTSVYSQSLREV
jgi:starch synthase